MANEVRVTPAEAVPVLFKLLKELAEQVVVLEERVLEIERRAGLVQTHN